MKFAVPPRATAARFLLCLLLAASVWGGGAGRAGAFDDEFGQGTDPGAAVQVRLVYEVSQNPPRHFGEGTAIDWNKPGLTLELLRMVGERLNIGFLFQRVPWKRGLFMVENGAADGIFHTSYLPARDAVLAYPRRADGAIDESRAIFRQSYSIYVRKNSAVRWDGAVFHNLEGPVGATASYSVVSDLRQMDVAVEEERSVTINLRKLLEGRIAATAELETITDDELDRHPAYADVIEKLVPPFRTKHYFLTLSRQFRAAEPELSERIWDAIAAVNASPEFAVLARSYR